MTSKELDKNNHVVRYCSSRGVDRENGLPTKQAFRLRKDEDHISVNWLEHFGVCDLSVAVDKVREALRNKDYHPSACGRFAVFKVGTIRAAISDKMKYVPRVKYVPTRDDASHAGIFVRRKDELVAAITLAEQIRRDPRNVYPGAVKNDSHPQ